MAASKKANPRPVQAADFMANRRATLGDTNPDPRSEAAGRQAAHLTPEPLAPGLLLLAKAAAMVLGDDADNEIVGASGHTVTNSSNKNNNKKKNNNSAVNDFNKGADDDSAEEVIEVRPLKKARTPTFHTPNRSLLVNLRSSRPSPKNAQSVNQGVTSESAHTPQPANSSPSPSTRLGASTAPDNHSAVSETSKKMCTDCERVRKLRCQVLKRELYHGACLRCVTRGEMEKCSLYERDYQEVPKDGGVSHGMALRSAKRKRN